MEENNRILLIDDDPGILDSYRNILAPSELTDITTQGALLFGDMSMEEGGLSVARYSIVSCERGLDGVEAVLKAVQQQRPFAIAFIDIAMPGIDGTETARRIWSIDESIKIVIVTAYSKYSPDEIIGVTHREDLFFLRKPFHSDEIRQFARALTKQWNLEHQKGALRVELEEANLKLEQFVKNLQRKVEEQTILLIQSEKMASIGLLAAGVAHEINNPISFVDSNLTTLKKYVARVVEFCDQYDGLEAVIREEGTERARALMDMITEMREKRRIAYVLADMLTLVDESLDGTRRVKRIVTDLKTFSRLDRDEIGFIDINETIELAINMIWNEFKHKASIERSYQELPQVRCNAQKISQVFINLLLNAVQAVEREGIVRVATSYGSTGLASGKDRVEIAVSDNGCGIPSECLPKIFDPFFTTKDPGKGTGLGLSIVYDIVQGHRGEIRVESEEGVGSTFTVSLPVENVCS